MRAGRGVPDDPPWRDREEDGSEEGVSRCRCGGGGQNHRNSGSRVPEGGRFCTSAAVVRAAEGSRGGVGPWADEAGVAHTRGGRCAGRGWGGRPASIFNPAPQPGPSERTREWHGEGSPGETVGTNTAQTAAGLHGIPELGPGQVGDKAACYRDSARGGGTRDQGFTGGGNFWSTHEVCGPEFKSKCGHFPPATLSCRGTGRGRWTGGVSRRGGQGVGDCGGFSWLPRGCQEHAKHGAPQTGSWTICPEVNWREGSHVSAGFGTGTLLGPQQVGSTREGWAGVLGRAVAQSPLAQCGHLTCRHSSQSPGQPAPHRTARSGSSPGASCCSWP